MRFQSYQCATNQHIVIGVSKKRFFSMQTHRRRPSKSILLPRVSHPHTSYYNHAVAGSHPFYPRRNLVHVSETFPDNTYIWGYALLTATAFIFVTLMYALIGSNYVPDTGNKILDWLKHDQYYCLLVPITAIVCIYFIMCNWMGMKFFRHN